ncbi:hypothetical protein HWV62_10134 [Athelia sp. TMB]|nr:hypothetical protein HWV62_10134 [Athelia sp. TMB]
MEGDKTKEKSDSDPTVARNVVIFGETGAGKSSVVNLIAGKALADVRSSASGCTFKSASYEDMVDDMVIRMHDTVGLNEGQEGTVSARDAIIELYQLIKGLEEGISLLVFCVRGRIKDTTKKNYRMFFEGLCQKQVPIILLVTGLELEEPDMESWWSRNAQEFNSVNMIFAGHACITSTKGKERNGRFMYDQEYSESRARTRSLISSQLNKVKPWRVDKEGFVKSFLKRTFNWFAEAFRLRPIILCKVLFDALVLAGFSLEEALKFSNQAARQEEET